MYYDSAGWPIAAAIAYVMALAGAVIVLNAPQLLHWEMITGLIILAFATILEAIDIVVLPRYEMYSELKSSNLITDKIMITIISYKIFEQALPPLFPVLKQLIPLANTLLILFIIAFVLVTLQNKMYREI